MMQPGTPVFIIITIMSMTYRSMTPPDHKTHYRQIFCECKGVSAKACKPYVCSKYDNEFSFI